jgi:Adenylate and Guanylate cyclase catalytic domain
MNRYFAEIRATIERHGGTVEKFIGDAVMAVFGIPRVQEDDVLRAVRAAADIRAQLPAIAAEVGVALRFRTGINTGAVLTGEGENLAIGDAINVAARLEQLRSRRSWRHGSSASWSRSARYSNAARSRARCSTVSWCARWLASGWRWKLSHGSRA